MMPDPIDTDDPGFDAVIFDLDGVVTQTAKIHARAWKETFDAFLKDRSRKTTEPFLPFDLPADYLQYVDGKPRYEGVKSFLASRGIRLPEGDPDDPPQRETVCGLGNRKDLLVKQILSTQGVEVYPATIELIHRLKESSLKVGIVSSSKNCSEVLDRAGIKGLFDARVDGAVSEEVGLAGKPDPALFLECARRLHVLPARTVVVEDAIFGVQAGRRGGFGLVLGVARSNNHAALLANGADRVVSDLSEVGLKDLFDWFRRADLQQPSALDHFERIADQTANRHVALFLDHDGTLAPIANRPDLAGMSEDMREIVSRLADFCPIAIVSGRSLDDIRAMVGIERLYYAGNHGLEIAGPKDSGLRQNKGAAFIPDLETAYARLDGPIRAIQGAFVENKIYSLSIHFRQASQDRVPQIEERVDGVLAELPRLRKHEGKKVIEIRPRIDWNKGKAVLWLLEALEMDRPDVMPIYIGDDVTDEDAFHAVSMRGIGIRVCETPLPTAAGYSVRNTQEVGTFLKRLLNHLARQKK